VIIVDSDERRAYEEAMRVKSMERTRQALEKLQLRIGTGRKQLPDFTLTGEQPDSSTWGETRRTQSSWSS
jgi:hypothetical protein